jgi:hypothetical protein
MSRAILFPFFILIAFAHIANGQIQSYSYGLQVSVGAGNYIMSAKNNSPVLVPWQGRNITYPQMVDSFKKIDGTRIGFSIGGNAVFASATKKVMIQVGFDYRNSGFRRHLKNLQQFDSIQYMGEITEHSSNGSKDITFRYFYHYIDLPILFHISTQSEEKRYKDFLTFVTFGINPNFLLAEKYHARLFGFSINEAVAFKGKDIQFQNNTFNLNAMLGGRFQYAIDDQLKVSVMPMINFPLMSQTKDTDDLSVRPYTISIMGGINFIIDHEE